MRKKSSLNEMTGIHTLYKSHLRVTHREGKRNVGRKGHESEFLEDRIYKLGDLGYFNVYKLGKCLESIKGHLAGGACPSKPGTGSRARDTGSGPDSCLLEDSPSLGQEKWNKISFVLRVEEIVLELQHNLGLMDQKEFLLTCFKSPQIQKFLWKWLFLKCTKIRPLN